MVCILKPSHVACVPALFQELLAADGGPTLREKTKAFFAKWPGVGISDEHVRGQPEINMHPRACLPEALVKKQEPSDTPRAKKTRSDSSSSLLKAGVIGHILHAVYMQEDHDKLTVCRTCLQAEAAESPASATTATPDSSSSVPSASSVVVPGHSSSIILRCCIRMLAFELTIMSV